MNVFSYVVGVVLAAEGFLLPITGTIPKPAVSFGQLVNALPLSDDQGEAAGTGTFSASIIAGVSSATPIHKTKKSEVTIAFLGDSMTDTLGADLRLVDDELKLIYPETVFTLHNYGVGGENIVSGLERITRSTIYLGIARPSIVSLRPDIVIVESFAYNPFPFETGALDQHWLSLAYIVDTLKANLPETKIVIAATIAPNKDVFGDNAPGIAFNPEDKQRRTATIKNYLENTIRFAQSQQLPIADAYHPSLDTHGEGKLLYINPGDHIHYSDAGRQFFARIVSESIVANKLLEQ